MVSLKASRWEQGFVYTDQPLTWIILHASF